MKRDFDYKLKNLDGSAGEVNGKAVRVKDEVIPALQFVLPGQILSPEQKIERYKLAVKAYDGGEQDLTQAELDLIKQCVGYAAAVLVVGQVADWCDNDAPTPPGLKAQPPVVEPPVEAAPPPANPA